MLGLHCKRGAAKAILLLEQGAPPASTFLHPAAVLQNHPRMEETRAKGREEGQEGPLCPAGSQERNTLLTGLVTGASPAADTMHGEPCQPCGSCQLVPSHGQ